MLSIVQDGCQYAMDQGIDVKAMYAGKKTLAMVERYSHQSGERIRAAMNKLDRRYRNLKG